MNNEVMQKALNHICFKCPNLKTQDYKRCFCELTSRRICFKDDVSLNCPLLYIAYSEINAPRYDIETHFKKKDDEHIYRIVNSYFNMDTREYEYYCWKLTAPQAYAGCSDKIKHSDIVEIISLDDERVKIK